MANFRVSSVYKLDSSAFRRILDEADLLIVQRLPMLPTFAKVCSAMNERGKLVIFEIDDDLTNLSPQSKYALDAPIDYTDRIRKAIATCNAVQCSTSELAERIRGLQPNVGILENQLESILPFTQKKEHDRLVIGYAAGEHHYPDWCTIRDEFNQAISKLEAEGHVLEIWIMGDRAIYESVNTLNKKLVPLLKRQDYLRVMTAVDLSLIPLENNAFNRCKSDIKFLESASAGAAVVASEVVYSRTVRHGETGFLYSTPNEFGRQLVELIRRPELLDKTARRAHAYVANQRLIRYHAVKWAETYRAWYTNRTTLIKPRSREIPPAFASQVNFG